MEDGPELGSWFKMLQSLRGPHGRRAVRTPVRWLCLRAFCYLADVQGRRLSVSQLDSMAQLIELGVFLNRCLDGKARFSASRYRQLRRGLPDDLTKTYLRALRQAEGARLQLRDWTSVSLYRREVSDLSLVALFRLGDLPARQVLSPLVALIQLVDDILDQRLDRRLGLPTLVTLAGPAPACQAKTLWRELKSYRQPSDQPLVGLGFLVYLLARFCACFFR